ncbi:MAG: hypothetical protein KDA45_13415 [Planctomycetales bacterium]|nr:hypothetical protein [Planctomycetales bacterium]
MLKGLSMRLYSHRNSPPKWAKQAPRLPFSLAGSAIRWTKSWASRLQLAGKVVGVGVGWLGRGSSRVGLMLWASNLTPVLADEPAGQPHVQFRFMPPASSATKVGSAADEACEQRPPVVRRTALVTHVRVVSAVGEQSEQPGRAERISPLSLRASQGAPRELPSLQPPPALDSRPLAVDATNAGRHGAHAGGSGEVSTPWLDIRPRILEKANRSLVPAAALPEDASHLPAATSVSLATAPHVAHLRAADFCAAAAFCHDPLYFEDHCLERHGQTHGLLGHVPGVHSGLHFMKQTAMLPLNVLREPPWRGVRSSCLGQGAIESR